MVCLFIGKNHASRSTKAVKTCSNKFEKVKQIFDFISISMVLEHLKCWVDWNNIIIFVFCFFYSQVWFLSIAGKNVYIKVM